jgi:adenosylmethionine-8-amino-7-oxononanoate aminotransferase
MSHVFPRVLDRSLPTAVSAEGVWISDAEGRRYLDAAGGAIVVNVGHGDPELLTAMREHASRVQYVHGTMFTTEELEAYADELAPRLPMDEPRIYPVSGGSEAVETALKLARAYHLARCDEERSVVVARRASYHGNSLGALDASGKEPLRAPYAPWLGRVVHVPAAYDYREPLTAAEHAEALEGAFIRAGRGRVAAFIAEPVAGATLAGAVPPDGYWAAAVDVCRRHGVLVIADEVMTGFGRTGRWFASEHFDLRPDILTAGKGSSSGYVPFGFAAASGPVFEAVRRHGFVHGFTWSHNGLGAAVARAVLWRLEEGGLIEASEKQGERIRAGLRDALADCPIVADVRGIGSMIGVELVRDRPTKEPFPRTHRATERVLAAGRDRGVLLYSSTGHVDGDGDLLMLGPPFVISDDECELAVERTVDAIAAVAAEG